MTKHTPTPWFANRHYVTDKRTFAIEASGMRVGETPNFIIDADNEANAVHIVKCVNAHDALVEAALEYLAVRPAFRMKPIGAEGSTARRQQEDEIAAEDKLRAALKLAGEA